MDDLVSTLVPSQAILQTPFDAAVVIPTVIRPSLCRAVGSVFRQRFAGRIQVLIGVDRPIGDRSILDEIRRECPAHCVVSVFDPGYSTSLRNGGLYPGGCGGALRTILSYAANSRAVAYLDDDNWFGEDHIRTLRGALVDHDYAFSLRWYVDRESGQPLCIDEWESVGPDVGVFRQRFGGFVDPNCLMLDKVKCEPALRWWCFPLPGDPRAMSEDRMVFDYLRKHHRGSATGRATSYYVIHPEDGMHPRRLQWVREKTGAAVPVGRGQAEDARRAADDAARGADDDPAAGPGGGGGQGGQYADVPPQLPGDEDRQRPEQRRDAGGGPVDGLSRVGEGDQALRPPGGRADA